MDQVQGVFGGLKPQLPEDMLCIIRGVKPSETGDNNRSGRVVSLMNRILIVPGVARQSLQLTFNFLSRRGQRSRFSRIGGLCIQQCIVVIL